MNRKLGLRNRRNGFTMIEMVIVLVVIGILAAIALPKLSTSGESAYVATMKSDASNARTSMTNFYSETGGYASVTVDGTNGATKAKIDSGKSNVEVAVSSGNKVEITQQTCNDGSDGYTLKVSSSKTGKTVSFDSCKDVSIKVE